MACVNVPSAPAAWVADGPMLLMMGIVTVMITRPRARITPDELQIRILLTRRIPRAQVESAKVTHLGLVIRRRDGGSEFAVLAPRMTSTELSWGGEPEPGSAAYEITRWARRRAPHHRHPVGDQRAC